MARQKRTAGAQEAADFGGTLRQLREARGVALRDIAESTKISVSALEALERNDVSRLPGGIFRRGIIRAYAATIGADPERLVRDFDARFGDGAAAPRPANAVSIDDDQRRTAGRAAIVIALLLLLVALLVWLFVAWR